MKNTTQKNRIWLYDNQIIELVNFVIDQRIGDISTSIKFKEFDKNEHMQILL